MAAARSSRSASPTASGEPPAATATSSPSTGGSPRLPRLRQERRRAVEATGARDPLGRARVADRGGGRQRTLTAQPSACGRPPGPSTRGSEPAGEGGPPESRPPPVRRAVPGDGGRGAPARPRGRAGAPTARPRAPTACGCSSPCAPGRSTCRSRYRPPARRRGTPHRGCVRPLRTSGRERGTRRVPPPASVNGIVRWPTWAVRHPEASRQTTWSCGASLPSGRQYEAMVGRPRVDRHRRLVDEVVRRRDGHGHLGGGLRDRERVRLARAP